MKENISHNIGYTIKGWNDYGQKKIIIIIVETCDTKTQFEKKVDLIVFFLV